MKYLHTNGTYSDWRTQAKRALREALVPDDVAFVAASQLQANLFASEAASAPAADRPTLPGPLRLPRAFVQAAPLVAVHRDEGRFDLLYRVLWRLTHGEPHLMDCASDRDVLRLCLYRKQVSRDVHKAHAFVRFRAVSDPDAADGRHYIAWYEPDHLVLPLSAPHFLQRFASMRWSILTPDASVACIDGKLVYGPGAKRAMAPAGDELEALWKTYYANIFNPARLNLRAQRQEMPRRFWQNAPEAALNRELTRTAAARAQAFVDAQPARAEPAAQYDTVGAIASDLARCSVCAWSAHATQAVAGSGPGTATLMLVGEQPGDQEDRQGLPFVGPAGRVLDEAFDELGLDRSAVYVTNAVKHFKFVQRGKLRLHQKPNATDVAACRGWLAAELDQVRPERLVCLGTTAALSVFGKSVRLHAVRGRWHVTAACNKTWVTMHPSAILRLPQDAQAEAFASLVADLTAAAAP